MTTADSEVLTPRQAAVLLGVDRRTIYALIEQGKVPCVKLSPHVWRIPKWMLLRQLETLALGDSQDDGASKSPTERL